MRYAIPESSDDSKYSITFTTVPYDDTNLQAEALENDPEYRQLVFLQMQEHGELSSRHAQERIRYLAKRRRDQRSTIAPKFGDWVRTQYGDIGRVYKVEPECPYGEWWLSQQARPVTEQQLEGQWLSVLVHGGGSVTQPISTLVVLGDGEHPDELVHTSDRDHFGDGGPLDTERGKHEIGED